MDSHNTSLMTESEEMYLLTLALLAEEGLAAPVPLSALAQARAIQPVSVNQMVRKLAEAGLVAYFPYKGVELTAGGRAIATRILRYRRLWEVLLVEQLGMADDQADSLACRLEHLTSDAVAALLARFLGDPLVSPQGKPIPRHDAPPDEQPGLPLAHLPVEAPARVLRVDADEPATAFLAAQGLRPGSPVRVVAAGAGGALLLEAAGHTLSIAPDLAARIAVLCPVAPDQRSPHP